MTILKLLSSKILIDFISKKIIKLIIKNSFGYIKTITYKKIDYLRFSYQEVAIETNINNSSIIIFPTIQLRPSLWFLKIVFSKDVIIKHAGNENIVEFEKAPILQFKIGKEYLLKLTSCLNISQLKNTNIDQPVRIILKAFTIKFAKRPEIKKEILISYQYLIGNHYQQNFNLDLEIIYGKSARTKSKYLKSLRLKDFEIKFINTSINASGFIEYFSHDYPKGELIFKINNPQDLAIEMFNDELEEIAGSLNNFLDIFIENTNKQNLTLNCSFTEKGVEINSTPLCEIQKKLK